MSNTSKIILVTIVATCILLGLGYAAITNITLNITGTASANVNQDNFDVSFIGTPVVSDSALATAKITDEVNATIGVSGLTTAGQEVTATYDIKNNSSDLSADLKVLATSTNTDYFKISSKLAKSSLVAKESTTVTVTVKLTKTPIDGDVSTNIDIDLTAMPVQPGEEGTSEGVNDYSESPINIALNQYGFYYNKPYSFLDTDGKTETLIFYEDASMMGYLDNIPLAKSCSDFVIYNYKSIDVSAFTGIEGSIITVSDDGTELYINNATYYINDNFEDIYANFTAEKNEYGFYYGQAYNSTNAYGELFSYVAYEDGSAELYIDYELKSTLPAGTLKYSYNTVVWGDDVYTLTENGKHLTNEYGSMVLDPNFWDRYNSVILLTFGEAYTLMNDDGTETAIVFYEDGSSKMISSEGSTISISAGTLKYSRTIIDDGSSNYTYISEDGTEIIIDGKILKLDPEFWTRNNITKPE